MRANSSLERRAVGARSVDVAAGVGAERPAVRLEFDEAGDVAGSFTDARPQHATKASETAIPTRAYASAASARLDRSRRSTWVVIEIEWPGGVAV
jgi:hypothetical protein